MTPEELAAMAARADAATPGPWLVKGLYPQEVLGNDDGLTLIATTHSSPDGPPSNTAFIAHAREDIPALLAVLRERENTIARVRDIVESVYATDDLDPDGYQVAGLIRTALDPQEFTHGA